MHLPRLLALLAVSLLPSIACAGTPVPTADLPGLADPPGLKRYTGAVLIGSETVAYDEITLPGGRIEDDESGNAQPRTRLPLATGQRTRAIYVLPAGRSPLEAVRGYQSDLAAAGYAPAWECAGDACGASLITDYSMLRQVWPRDAWAFDDASPAGCASGNSIVEPRYLAMRNAASGAVLGIVAWRTDVTSVYCDERAFQQRTSVVVVSVVPQPREQAMSLVSAADMQRTITDTGRVAIYGILFDTASATLKPASRPALDEIAKLLREQPALGLHVVGHTDNQGGLEANFDLSRRRAAAVREVLTGTYGIAASRLTANGVSYLAPVASNADENGRAKNRRVELVPL